MKRRLGIFIAVGLLALVLILANQFRISHDKNTPPPEPSHTYATHCASCHGPDGRDFHGKSWKFNSHAEIEGKVLDGMLVEGMPAFNGLLTKEEVRGLAEYVLLQGRKEEYRYRAEDGERRWTVADGEIDAELVYVAESAVWGLAALGQSEVIFTEVAGELGYIHGNQVERIEGLPDDICYEGQGGLLDVSVDPLWPDSNWIYLTYSKYHSNDRSLSATALIRGRFDAQAKRLSGIEELFVAQPYHDVPAHYGSRVVWEDDEHLFLSCGERTNHWVFPQDLTNDCGKIHRLRRDGSIPDDNPFSTASRVSSIYAFGNRNPQGLVINYETGELWEHEHGPKGGDELNLILPGRNYGWAAHTYGIDYDGTPWKVDSSVTGIEAPMHHWIPSIAPCGMALVERHHSGGDSLGEQANAFSRWWGGDFLIGSLAFSHLERISTAKGRVIRREKMLEGIGRVRDVEADGSGAMYLATGNPNAIYRLTPVAN